eukprot:4934319-Amphidinium_carterae.1
MHQVWTDAHVEQHNPPHQMLQQKQANGVARLVLTHYTRWAYACAMGRQEPRIRVPAHRAAHYCFTQKLYI